MAGSAIVNGKLYQDVYFVNSREEAEIEILYDETSLDKENNCWLYFYRGYLVATAPNRIRSIDRNVEPMQMLKVD